MNANSLKHWLLLCLCSLILLPVFASSICAAPAADGIALQANIIWDFASDRTRMIQVSLVIVTIGCAMMWWYR